MEGIGGGDVVLEEHEDDGADQRAVERAGAAQHQHHQRFGREREAQAVEADDLGGDGVQRPADAGDGAGDHIHLDQRRFDRGAHGARCGSGPP